MVRGDLAFGLSRRVVNFGLMKQPVGSVSPVYKVFHIDPSSFLPELLERYLRTRMSDLMDILRPGAREGQPIDRDHLLAKMILVPPMNVQQAFCQAIAPLDRAADNAANGSEALGELRNVLLPRLLSGWTGEVLAEGDMRAAQ